MTKEFVAFTRLDASDVNAYLVNRPLQNAIINGAFEINQRNFSSTTTTGTYGFDRFRFGYNGGTTTYSAQAFTPGAAPLAGYEATNFARLASTGQSTAGNFAYLFQPVEDVRNFAGQTVTISFFAKAETGTPNVGVSLEQIFGSGGSTTVVTSAGVQAITTSWARYSFTVAVPSVSGKTIGASSSLVVGLMTSVGTTISDSGYPVVGIQNATIDFWGIQLEAGSVANPFRRNANSIQGELAACQRYYQKYEGGIGCSLSGAGASSTSTVMSFSLPVSMRTTVSAGVSGQIIISDQYATDPTASSASLGALQGATNKGGRIVINGFTGINVGRFYSTPSVNVGTGIVEFSAEL